MTVVCLYDNAYSKNETEKEIKSIYNGIQKIQYSGINWTKEVYNFYTQTI